MGEKGNVVESLGTPGDGVSQAQFASARALSGQAQVSGGGGDGSGSVLSAGADVTVATGEKLRDKLIERGVDHAIDEARDRLRGPEEAVADPAAEATAGEPSPWVWDAATNQWVLRPDSGQG